MNRATISKERLNEIARRKLFALGIATGLARDGQTLVGIIPVKAGAMVNPASTESIEEIRFAVEGHDHLRLLSPPALAELPPQAFYDYDRPALLLARISEQLARRFAAAREWEARLRARNLVAQLDPARIIALGQLDLGPGGKVLLEGSARGLFATRAVRPGAAKALKLGEVPIDLEEFPDLSDLELSLARWIEEAEKRPAAAPEPAPAADALEPAAPPAPRQRPAPPDFGSPPPVMTPTGASSPAAAPPPSPAAQAPAEPAPPPMQPVTPALTQPVATGSAAPGLGVRLSALLGKLDADVRVLTFTAVKEITVGEDRLRFTIEQRGEAFVGKLQKPGEVLWEEPIDLTTFPGVGALITKITGIEVAGSPAQQVAAALGVPPPAAPPAAAARPSQATEIDLPAPAPGSQPSGPIPAHALPIGGECWVMDVRVVAREGGEVRYAPVNAYGQTYGAPRVLPEANFQDAFLDLGGGSFRLAVEVLRVEPEKIWYQQLDAQRGRVGNERCIPPAIFVSTFLPEAASY